MTNAAEVSPPADGALGRQDLSVSQDAVGGRGTTASPPERPAAPAALKHPEPPEYALERICEAHWGGAREGDTVDGVTFSKITQHNACNHTLSGTIDIDGELYGFTIDNGDWGGTEVRAWGDARDLAPHPDPEPPEPRTFLPNDPDLFSKRPQMWRVYLAWRREPWFRELERGYNYDRHFQPGCKVEDHYRAKAAQRGLRIGYLSHLTDAERASIQAPAGAA